MIKKTLKLDVVLKIFSKKKLKIRNKIINILRRTLLKRMTLPSNFNKFNLGLKSDTIIELFV